MRTKFWRLIVAIGLLAAASTNKVAAATFFAPVDGVLTISGVVTGPASQPFVSLNLSLLSAPSFPGCLAILNQCDNFAATFASYSILTSISEYNQSGDLIDSRQIGVYLSNCSSNSFCASFGQNTQILGNGLSAGFPTPVDGLTLAFSSEIFSTNVHGMAFLILEIPDNLTVTGFRATPLPGALPLFATGLGALGLIGWRRKQRAAARLQ